MKATKGEISPFVVAYAYFTYELVSLYIYLSFFNSRKFAFNEKKDRLGFRLSEISLFVVADD